MMTAAWSQINHWQYSQAAKVAAYNASHPNDTMPTYERMNSALGYQFVSVKEDVPK